MAEKLRPLHDRVIVERMEEQNERSPGGIFIPETAKEKPQKAKVIAVGNGKILENGDVRKLDIKIGDIVLFGKYAGSEVKLNGKDVLVMREDDIMAVLEG